MLFVTTWARQRDWASGSFQTSNGAADMSHNSISSWFDDSVGASSSGDLGRSGRERFGGWEGAEGAGKRAFEHAATARKSTGSSSDVGR